MERVAALEELLEGEKRERAELAERTRATAGEVAELERRYLAERERAGTTAKMAAESARRLADAERQLGEVGERAGRLALEAAHAEKRAADAETRLGEVDEQIAALTEQLEAAQQQAAAAGEDRGTVEEAAAEIAGLEGALLERGRVVAKMARDLREAERVGKELLGELESARGWNGSGPPAEDLRGRLDTLAQSAARGEADLTAANWRIAQLERELGEARGEPGSAGRAQLELEQALAAARDEVAALRRAMGATGG
jgi:hypothetical protein